MDQPPQLLLCNHVYNGSQLTQETVTTKTATDDGTVTTVEVLYYAYDAGGTPLSVTLTDNDGTESTYYYAVNTQGDVTAILTTDGTAVVEYTYDAWGVILTTAGTLADTLGEINSLRYRGYVYDEETGYYYLQSRYYNPELGRFLNADAYASTGQGLLGNNMFAYCNNSPVLFEDPSGTMIRIDIIYGGGESFSGSGTGLVGSASSAQMGQDVVRSGSSILGSKDALKNTIYVIDVSASFSFLVFYGKRGSSIIIDLKNKEIVLYSHKGGGGGLSVPGLGITGSLGTVSNYAEPEDYAGSFYDYNIGAIAGIDYCYNPRPENGKLAANATSVTIGNGAGIGVGYDYYTQQLRIPLW